MAATTTRSISAHMGGGPPGAVGLADKDNTHRKRKRSQRPTGHNAIAQARTSPFGFCQGGKCVLGLLFVLCLSLPDEQIRQVIDMKLRLVVIEDFCKLTYRPTSLEDNLQFAHKFVFI